MTSVLKDVEQAGLPRRKFLQNMFLAAGSISTAHWLTACGSSPERNVIGTATSTATGAPTPPTFQSKFATMGPLQAANSDGIQLPAGFTSRELAVFGEAPLLSDPSFLWHSDPDGGGTFRTADGGWIYVSNSEARDGTTGGLSREQQALLDPGGAMSFRGGVSALQFNSNGDLVDAYAVERGTTTNCSGGTTPWGTWINGEEIQDGYMFECSPLRGGGTAERLDNFGRKGHEMVAVDPDGQAIYHTEDAGGNDRFYRNTYSDAAWPGGNQRPNHAMSQLEVMGIPAGVDAARNGPTPIIWIPVNDITTPLPQQYNAGGLPQSTLMAGNEGVWYLNGFIFLTTKSDDNIWAIDTLANTIESIYDPTDGPIGSPVDPSEPIMTGVDNICMTLDGEMLVVEDGGDMRCMVLLPDRTTIPLMRLPGDAGLTEVTGVAIGPTGDRIYVSGQRSLRNGASTAFNAGGITYEIQMPFTVNVDRPLAGNL